MSKCPICGKEHSAAFCPDCGIKLEEPRAQGSYAHVAAANDLDKPLGMWEYVLMNLVSSIPIVNLVLYCVWGFSSGTNTNRKNWSRAQLIWAAIGLVGGILLVVAGIIMFSAVGVTSGIVNEIMREVL